MKNKILLDNSELLFAALGTLLLFFFIALYAYAYFIKFCVKKAYYDLPNEERKTHQNPVPSSGGIIFSIPALGMLIVCFLTANYSLSIGASLLLLFVGLIDDRLDLSPKLKLLFQFLAAGALLYDLHGLNGVEGGMNLIYMGLIFFFIVGFTNAFNLIDGVDGLAGTYGVFVLIALSIGLFMTEQYLLAIYALSILGVLIAFLTFNWKPAKVFMGDTGSLFLGFSIAFLALKILNATPNYPPFFKQEYVLILLFCLLLLPMLDTVRVMFVRSLKGHSPLKADRNHLHHLLERLGLKSNGIALFFVITTFLVSLEGLILNLFEVALGIIFSTTISSVSLLFVVLIMLRIRQHKKRIEKIQNHLEELTEENQLMLRKAN